MADDLGDTVLQIRRKRDEAFNKSIDLLNNIGGELSPEDQEIFPSSKQFMSRAVKAVVNECEKQYGDYQTRNMPKDEKLFEWTIDAIEKDLGLKLTNFTLSSTNNSNKRINAAKPANGLIEMDAAVKAAVAAAERAAKEAAEAAEQARVEDTTEAAENADMARIKAEEATKARNKIINKQSIYLKLFNITHPFVNLIAIYDIYIEKRSGDNNKVYNSLISSMDKYNEKAKSLMNEVAGIKFGIKLVTSGGRKKQLKNNRSKTYRKRKSKTYRKRKSKTYRKRKSKTYRKRKSKTY